MKSSTHKMLKVGDLVTTFSNLPDVGIITNITHLKGVCLSCDIAWLKSKVVITSHIRKSIIPYENLIVN